MDQNSSDFEQEFLAAYDAYAEAIYRHCVFRVYNAELAEELMQETFMKTWQYLAKGNEIENLRAFLYRVANNLVIDYSRRKKEDSLEAMMSQHPDFEPSMDISKKLEHNLLLDQVLKELKTLPAEIQEILTLRFVDDLDPKDIAVILGITPNNASVRINRALRLLQQKVHNPQRGNQDNDKLSRPTE